MRPAPRAREQGASSRFGANQPQADTFPAGTPWQRSASVIQPASRTSLRLSFVIGFGVRRIELRLFPPGVLNDVAPVTLLGSELLPRWIAASPALLPSRRGSFQRSAA